MLFYSVIRQGRRVRTMSSVSKLSSLQRHKRVHLVRHAQGVHNVEGEKDVKAYLSPETFDAHLTSLGWQQVYNLRKHVHVCGLAKKVELVITSPLLRTMQTAVGVFGGEDCTDVANSSPLMVANAGSSNRSAISSLGCPTFIAVETCREHLGVYPCDKRRSIMECQQLFPAIDFSLIESDEDILWKPKVRETKTDLAARGMNFLNWLWTRTEEEIVVVTHGDFLYYTLRKIQNDFKPFINVEMCTRFANCELRSIMLIGSDETVTTFSGGLLMGFHLSSDKLEEKHPDEEESTEHNIKAFTIAN